VSEPVSITGPVELIFGKLVLRIPLSPGGAQLAPLTRTIGAIDGDYLWVMIPDWLAEKLRIGAGSLVTVDNYNSKVTITRSAENDAVKGDSESLSWCVRGVPVVNPRLHVAERGAGREHRTAVGCAGHVATGIGDGGRASDCDGCWRESEREASEFQMPCCHVLARLEAFVHHPCICCYLKMQNPRFPEGSRGSDVIGVGDGSRTRDFLSHSQALYP
jgi:hypothetical protein